MTILCIQNKPLPSDLVTWLRVDKLTKLETHINITFYQGGNKMTWRNTKYVALKLLKLLWGYLFFWVNLGVKPVIFFAIRSEEKLTLEMSAFQIFNGLKFDLYYLLWQNQIFCDIFFFVLVGWFDYCLMVSWFSCFLWFTSLVILTGFYTNVKPFF